MPHLQDGQNKTCNIYNDLPWHDKIIQCDKQIIIATSGVILLSKRNTCCPLGMKLTIPVIFEY